MTYLEIVRKTPPSLSIAFLALLLFFPTTTLDAQHYMKNLGTRGLEISLEMTPTSDGNFVTVGPVTRPPNAPPGVDIYLNKVDPLGNLIWTQRVVEFSGADPGNAIPFSITETTDAAGNSNGFALTGIVRTSQTLRDPILVVTTDSVGVPIKYNSYGGSIPGTNFGVISGVGVQIIQTPDGNLAVCGSVILDDFVGMVPLIMSLDPDLNLHFLKLYEDARYGLGNLFGFDTRAHFADIEYIEAYTSPNGVVYPEGFVVVGTTSKMNDWYTEIIVARTDLNGNPLRVALHGPQQMPSRGTALTVTNQGNIQVAGLQFSPTGGPPSTLVLKLDPVGLAAIDQDQYYGFITAGDIRQISDDHFVLAGRDTSSPPEAAVLRIKVDGSLVFAKNYQGANVEIFTDVHEVDTASLDLLSSGLSTTYTRGPIDELLARSKDDGSIPGCPVADVNVDPAAPNHPMRDTELPQLQLDLTSTHDWDIPNPNTLVFLICPLFPGNPVPGPVPWDWFIRADHNRDLQVNVADAIGSLERLFVGGPAAVPEEAADSNADGVHDVSDVIHSLAYLFGGGSPPVAPFEEPGPDPSSTAGNVFNMQELNQFVSGLLDEAGVLSDLFP